MEGRKMFVVACGLLALAAAPAMAVVTVHDLNAYTAGAPLSQAGGAFTAGGDTTGQIDIIDVGGGQMVAQVTGTGPVGSGVAALTNSSGAGDVAREAGMLYAGFDLYCPDPVVGAGTNILDFQLLSGNMVFHLLSGPDTGYLRDPYKTVTGSYVVTPGWHSIVMSNYSDGTDANSWVKLTVDGVQVDHITKATAGYGIWPALASSATARAQALRVQATPRAAEGGVLYIDNIWGGNTMVPEPATLGLLALGTLFVGRRSARA